MDLAEGHAASLNYLSQALRGHAIDLGTDKGYSVLEMAQTFEKASGREVPYKVVSRRIVDVAAWYVEPRKARNLLNWNAIRVSDHMCADACRQHLNTGP
jgi:UDP-glucose 4-epimerase